MAGVQRRPVPADILRHPAVAICFDYLRAMISVTLFIIAFTVVLSVMAFSNERLLNNLLLWPAYMREPVQYYRLLTAGFVHADYMHLAFNMITLYFFGGILEQAIGSERFIALYLIGIIVSCIPSYLKKKNHPGYRSLGASGGVAAVIFAYIYLSPWSKIYLFFAIGMPSIIFAVIYLVYTAYLARKGTGIVNHDAHLWGSVFGLLFMLIIDPSHGAYFIDQLAHPQF
jgi:membrane associated rhomboid family serine protease